MTQAEQYMEYYTKATTYVKYNTNIDNLLAANKDLYKALDIYYDLQIEAQIIYHQGLILNYERCNRSVY